MKAHLMEHLEFNTKFITVLLLTILTTLKTLFGEYIFDDVKFLVGIGCLMITDGISGAAVASIRKEFKLTLLFKKTIKKVGSYALFIFGVSILLKIKVGDQQAGWVQWLDDYLYMGVALAEFWSIVQKVDIINPGLIPERLKKYIKDSTDKGEFTKLLILMFVASWFFLGCVTKREILNELRSYKAKQDSLLSTNYLLYSYEKARIDSVYRNINDADLLRRIEFLTSPKPKNQR